MQQTTNAARWQGGTRQVQVQRRRTRPSIPQRTETWRQALRRIGPAVYACVGTDRSTGDSLGPLVGTLLTEAGIPNVWGTLDAPLHAGNLRVLTPVIERDALARGLDVLAIDATLGSYEHIGDINLLDVPLRPGLGVRKDLPPIGDHTLTVTVNIAGFAEIVVLQSTRLALTYNRAREIAGEIIAMHAKAEAAATATDGGAR